MPILETTMKTSTALERLEAGEVDVRLFDEFYLEGNTVPGAHYGSRECIWRAHVLGRYLEEAVAAPIEAQVLRINIGNPYDPYRRKRAEMALKKNLGEDIKQGVLWPNKSS